MTLNLKRYTLDMNLCLLNVQKQALLLSRFSA